VWRFSCVLKDFCFLPIVSQSLKSLELVLPTAACSDPLDEKQMAYSEDARMSCTLEQVPCNQAKAIIDQRGLQARSSASARLAIICSVPQLTCCLAQGFVEQATATQMAVSFLRAPGL
jgi:hypothetical protein